MRTLAMQASNDTNTASDRANLNDELTDLQAELTRIAETATFNNQNLLEGTMSSSTYQVGHKAGETIALSIADFSADSIGSQNRIGISITSAAAATDTVAVTLDTASGGSTITYTASAADSSANETAKQVAAVLNQDDTFATYFTASVDPVTAGELIIQRHDGTAVTAASFTVAYGSGDQVTGDAAAADASDLLINATSVTTRSNAQNAVVAIDNALAEVSRERANLGAFQNRLEHAVSNMMNMSANTSDARSVIADADYAQESSALAKNQILQQAGTAMLAQANAQSQTVLSLLK